MSERGIYTALERDFPRQFSPTGCRFRDKISVARDKDGNRYLEKTGQTDAQELINSHRDGCDVRSILERCMVTGDLSPLQKMQGTYGDTTAFRNDPQFMHAVMARARTTFEGLSPSVKAHYSTFEDFLEAFATPENMKVFSDKINKIFDTPASADPVGGEVNESQQ